MASDMTLPMKRNNHASNGTSITFRWESKINKYFNELKRRKKFKRPSLIVKECVGGSLDKANVCHDVNNFSKEANNTHSRAGN